MNPNVKELNLDQLDPLVKLQIFDTIERAALGLHTKIELVSVKSEDLKRFYVTIEIQDKEALSKLAWLLDFHWNELKIENTRLTYLQKLSDDYTDLPRD